MVKLVIMIFNLTLKYDIWIVWKIFLTIVLVSYNKFYLCAPDDQKDQSYRIKQDEAICFIKTLNIA